MNDRRFVDRRADAGGRDRGGIGGRHFLGLFDAVAILAVLGSSLGSRFVFGFLLEGVVVGVESERVRCLRA